MELKKASGTSGHGKKEISKMVKKFSRSIWGKKLAFLQMSFGLKQGLIFSDRNSLP